MKKILEIYNDLNLFCTDIYWFNKGYRDSEIKFCKTLHEFKDILNKYSSNEYTYNGTIKTIECAWNQMGIIKYFEEYFQLSSKMGITTNFDEYLEELDW